jgi:KaiC/GvpD/RAD55 family RecA-like ATPase
MIEFNRGEIQQYYRTRVPGLKLVQGKLRAPCPIHQGKDPNFAIDAETGRWYCHSQCSRGGDLMKLEMELTGADFIRAKKEVFQMLGRPAIRYEDRDAEAFYDYTDEHGKVLYRVVRLHGVAKKEFVQRRPDPEQKSGWRSGLGGARLVPFRLPELLKAQVVAITEGEKDVLNLMRAGWTATTNNGGAEHFHESLAPHFAGRDVVIFPDNDEKGRRHAQKVAALLHPVATQVRIVELPDLPLAGDVSDYLATGKTGEDLKALAQDAEVWSPDWNFKTAIPHENDRYLRTFAEAVAEAGGYQKFWKSLEVEGIPTPFSQLTQSLGGLRDGEVYVLGANQGAGKTSLMLQFVIAALAERYGVLIFSMEMTHRDVFQRLAAIDARVDLAQFRRLKRTSPTSEKLADCEHRLLDSSAKFSRAPLRVSTKSAVTPEFLTRESQRIKERGKVDLVIVDHMQLMGVTGRVRSDYEKFTAISRETKGIAMELGVPLILVSQTSRLNTHDRRAELEVSDLRGSGAIEEDAAAVMLLYYDSDDFKLAKSQPERMRNGPLRAWLKLGKNRFGPQNTYAYLNHFKALTRFDLIEQQEIAA